MSKEYRIMPVPKEEIDRFLNNHHGGRRWTWEETTPGNWTIKSNSPQVVDLVHAFCRGWDSGRTSVRF